MYKLNMDIDFNYIIIIVNSDYIILLCLLKLNYKYPFTYMIYSILVNKLINLIILFNLIKKINFYLINILMYIFICLMNYGYIIFK